MPNIVWALGIQQRIEETSFPSMMELHSHPETDDKQAHSTLPGVRKYGGKL